MESQHHEHQLPKRWRYRMESQHHEHQLPLRRGNLAWKGSIMSTSCPYAFEIWKYKHHEHQLLLRRGNLAWKASIMSISCPHAVELSHGKPSIRCPYAAVTSHGKPVSGASAAPTPWKYRMESQHHEHQLPLRLRNVPWKASIMSISCPYAVEISHGKPAS